MFEGITGGTPEVDTIVHMFHNEAAKDFSGNKFKQFKAESRTRYASKSAFSERTVFVSCNSESIREWFG